MKIVFNTSLTKDQKLIADMLPEIISTKINDLLIDLLKQHKEYGYDDLYELINSTVIKSSDIKIEYKNETNQ